MAAFGRQAPVGRRAHRTVSLPWHRHPRSPCSFCLSRFPPSITLGLYRLARVLARPGPWLFGLVRHWGVGQPSPCGHRPVAHNWHSGGRGDGDERVYRVSEEATGKRSARRETPVPEAKAPLLETAGYRRFFRRSDPLCQTARQGQHPSAQGPQAKRRGKRRRSQRSS
jgi:hypothetical protein